MADEVVVAPTGTPETPSASPEAATPEQVAAPAPSITPTNEQLDAFLREKSHEDLKQYPSYNAVAKRISEQERKAAQAEAQAQQARDGQMRQAAAYYDNAKQTNPAAFIQLMEDPQHVANYQAVQTWKRSGGANGAGTVDEAGYGRREAARLRQEFADDPEYEGIDLDKLPSDTAAGFVKAVTDLVNERKRKTMESAVRKEMKAELEAMQKEWEARIFAGNPEAQPVQAGVAGNGKAPSPQEYAAMSPTEREKARQDGRVDQWAKSWQGQ